MRLSMVTRWTFVNLNGGRPRPVLNRAMEERRFDERLHTGHAMSKLSGLAAVDWIYRCKYMHEIEESGRRRLTPWETELKNWDPEDDRTMPSGYALSAARSHVHDLH